MILTAGKYSDVRAKAGGAANGAVRTPRPTSRVRTPGLFVPTLSGNKDCLRDWFWREMKDGGWLHTYLQREKASTPRAVRHIARLMQGFQQNNKSDFQRKATIPAKLYHRWKDEDPNFFDDDNNLRSLKRDNPDVCVYVGPRQLPTTRLRKTYDGRAGSPLPAARDSETTGALGQTRPTLKP